MNRIVVIGSTGSGKSTLAEQLAAAFSVPFVELDALFWGPNWEPVGDEAFLERVTRAISADQWVVAGNYSSVRQTIWARADTVVWLDYYFVVNAWRLLRRTIHRSWFKYELWGTGNVESWRKQFMSRDSLFLWLWESYPRRKLNTPMFLADPQNKHLSIVHLRSPFEASRWLKRIKSTYGA